MLPRSESFEVVPNEDAAAAPSTSTEANVEDTKETFPAIEEEPAVENPPCACNKKPQPFTKGEVEGEFEVERPNLIIHGGEDRARSTRRRPRRPSYSPVRYYSPAPVRIYSRSPSPSRRSSLDEVSSHVDLIPIMQKKKTTTTTEPSSASATTPKNNTWKDRSVRLQPFNRKAYITTHAASVIDFRTWLPILAFAMPDHWYTYPNLKSLAPFLDIPTGLSAAAAQIALPPAADSRPIALTVPMVSASAALTTTFRDDDDENEEEDEDEDSAPLLYLSVQQATSGASDYNDYMFDRGGRRQIPDLAKEGPVIGTPLYRVVRTGSRDAAASLAFYTAGASRWSTVFTCVVAANNLDGDAGLCPSASSYSRAKSLKDLVAPTRSKGKIRIFY